MKKRNWIKALGAFLCAIALVVSNISPLQVAKATDTSELHELTWSDFGIPCNGVSDAKSTLQAGKEINNSLFNGDVTMQANSDIRYLGSADYTGLIITVTEAGSLKLSTAASWSNELTYGKEYTADTFALETFAGTKFNLKIAVTEYTTKSAKVSVWVNDQMVEENFTIIADGEMGTYMSLFSGTIEPHGKAIELHELNWSDFGISCNGVSDAKSTLKAGKEINNSLFNGDVTMQAGSDIRYLGSADYTGLIIAVTEGGSLKLSTAASWSNELAYGKEYTADTFALATFAGTKFNLKIAVTEYTTKSANVRVWVNDQLVESLTITADGEMGTYMSLFSGTIVPDYVMHDLTWSDFNIPCDGVSDAKNTLSSDKEMNCSLFSGYVTMQAGSEIRYAGASDFTGLVIGVTESGNLKLSTAAMWSDQLAYGQEYTAETFGLTTFADKQFNLKIAVTEYSTASAMFKVYVDDQLVGDAFTIVSTDVNYPLGTYMSLYTGAIEPADEKGHDLIHFEAVEPRCHYDGNVEYWFCKDCEGFWTDEACTVPSNSKDVVLPAMGSDNVVHVEAKAPTCIAEGNIEYWHCPDCEQFWQDKALTQLTDVMNVKLGTVDHTAVKVPAVPAQVGKTGRKEGSKCSVCNTILVKQEIIPALELAAPKATKVNKTTGGKKKITVKFKKVSGVTRYEIQIATKKNMKKGLKTYKVTKAKDMKNAKYVIKSLKSKKTYYVRIRTVKTVNGVTKTSSWSKVVKASKTK